ncbi:MAG: 2-keto-4-pentenoate hydratase [Vulcanimicrobiaceae bacterium]
MNAPTQPETIAAELLRAWRERSLLEAPSRSVPGFSAAHALAVAERLRELRIACGDRPAGYKVGFTNPAVRAQFSADGMLAATVYESTLAPEPKIEAGRLLGPRIEPEVVLGVQAGGVAWAAFGFEIVQSHVPEWNFGWVDAIADFGLHAALVIGAKRPFAPDDGARLEGMRVQLLRDGELVERGRGSDVEGGPLGSLSWLREHLAGLGRDLREGELVSTGSLTRVPAIAPGERWTIEAEGGELQPLTIEIV